MPGVLSWIACGSVSGTGSSSLSLSLSLSLMLSAFSPAAAASVLSTFRVIDILTSITALSGRKTCAYPTCLTPFCICLARVVVVAVVVYQVKALVTNVTRELLANDSSAFQTPATCLDQPRAASAAPRDESRICLSNKSYAIHLQCEKSTKLNYKLKYCAT